MTFASHTDTSFDRAVQLDAEDELAEFRQRFVPIADPSVVAYLDGNSLGRPLLSTESRLVRFVREDWGSRLIRSWDEGWVEWPDRIGDELGRVALGAAPGQVVIADSTTVCLYKTIAAALRLRPGRVEIVTDPSNFPTDRFVVDSIAEECRLTVRPVSAVHAEDVAAVVGDRTAVVVLSHVDYRSAAIADLAAITRIVHDSGGLVVWDLCHSVGSLPVELDAARVDFAVGCTYKFLNGGPGSPAFLYVNSRHHNDFHQPISGWMGAADIFGMAERYRPAPGVRGAVSGTPPILGMIGVAEGIALVAEAGIDRIRAKAQALGRWVIELADARLAPLGFSVASPRSDDLRGAHVTLRHPDAAQLSRALIANGIIIDFRNPDGIRLGLSPLSTSFTEIWRAVDGIVNQGPVA